MHVVHTAAVPPNQGRMALLTSGCTWKSRKALTKIVAAKFTASQTLREDAFIKAAYCNAIVSFEVQLFPMRRPTLT